MSTCTTIYHMCPKSAWETCTRQGREYYPSTYEKDGFIHATKDPTMLVSIANHFYKDAPVEEEWVILVIDSDRLASKVIFEPAAPVGDTSSFHKDDEQDVPLFPHIYGTIQEDSVVDMLTMARDSTSGTFLEL
jgi:uncharacterized protein (DUF952 family)